MRISRIQLKTSAASYTIHVGRGVLAKLHPHLLKLSAGRPLRCFVVTSPGIWELWSKVFLASFPPDGTPTVLMLPAGERHKRLASVEKLAEQMATAGADRDTLLIAFGGGVIGDVTGFLAAIYMRGVPYVQAPTTLLAQVDSSVGGKTGVNLLAGKNLVGAFHQPRAVFADIDVLSTLPPPELRAGLQEAIKAGIIQDIKLFNYLTKNNGLILGCDLSALAKVIVASIKVKADVVSRDEREAGPRMALNFGHTIGHAIEAATGYKRLLHGEAVAWGSIAALYVGLGRGTVTREEFAKVASVILAYGPLPRFHASAAQLVALTASDKKRRSGRRAFVLPRGIGATEIVFDVDDGELEAATTLMLADMRAATRPGRPA